MLRRLANWLLTLGGSWHPVRVETDGGYYWAACRCGWTGSRHWYSRRRAQQDAYDHQGMGGRAL